MAQEVTIGGERLGSGSKMKQELYNYGMNSFNQNRIWWSTAAPGLLYPCFKEIGTNHGTFDIDIDPFVRTLPTKGPLFGSFKMQVDLFNVPFRLYQGILHNNPVDIGLHMNEVYLPAMIYKTIDGKTAPIPAGATMDDCQVSTNSLLKYMGISGAGHRADWSSQDQIVARKFQCIPELGYYDIFKNYYSNKQEENAYVIMPGGIVSDEANIIKWKYNSVETEPDKTEEVTPDTYTVPIYLKGTNWSAKNIMLNLVIYNDSEDVPSITIDDTIENIRQKCFEAVPDKSKPGIAGPGKNYNTTGYNSAPDIIIYLEEIAKAYGLDTEIYSIILADSTVSLYPKEFEKPEYTSDIRLVPFALKNIDKMRAKLLALNELGDQFIIDWDENDDTGVWGSDSGADESGLPYCANLRRTEEEISYSAFNQTGLVTKTYQSDMFNNWLDNSLVDTIAQRTKIDTTSGGFTPDTLILQEKIYKYLNRVLVSGGTYYDWQEATYGEGVARMCEIPMYIGGMSTEIMFEEVIANNENVISDKYQALGSLAGKGTQTGKKGGNNIHVRMDEPGYIIGIMSITPRISVFQGNDWDRTELMTMDDLHKPELDGIGFQDLMVEQMCWWNTVLNPDGVTPLHRDAVGKQTAWLHYQTALDRVYGDFAKNDGYSYMVLSRQYEHSTSSVFAVKDLTTYIDPAKYNYAFAYQDLAAQNFWVELAFKCTSRRKMGAQQLPTL